MPKNQKFALLSENYKSTEFCLTNYSSNPRPTQFGCKLTLPYKCQVLHCNFIVRSVMSECPRIKYIASHQVRLYCLLPTCLQSAMRILEQAGILHPGPNVHCHLRYYVPHSYALQKCWLNAVMQQATTLIVHNCSPRTPQTFCHTSVACPSQVSKFLSAIKYATCQNCTDVTLQFPKSLTVYISGLNTSVEWWGLSHLLKEFNVLGKKDYGFTK